MPQSELEPVVEVERKDDDGFDAVADKISHTNITTDESTDLEHGHVVATAGGDGGDEVVAPPPQHHHHQRHSQSYSRVRSFATSFMYSPPMHDSDDLRPYARTSVVGTTATVGTRTTFGAYGHHNQDGLMVADKFPLTGSVYSLITVAPVFSWAFVVASYWIILKFVLFAFLLPDAINNGIFKVMHDPKIIVVRFLLIPVTVGMQGNLIHAVSYIARAKYNHNMTQIAPNATHFKYNLSLALELIDGILSLCVNAMVIMTTDQMLDIFLDFASLYFLQDIDRIGYELIEAGFFGRTMELWCHVINRIELPRRNSDHGKMIDRVTTSLFFGTVIVLLFLYSLIVWNVYGPSPSSCLFRRCTPHEEVTSAMHTGSNS